MKKILCVMLVLVVLGCSSAWAQFVANARELGMAGVGVAIADDAAAVYQNPAGLACLGIKGDPGQSFVNDVAATYLNANMPGTPFSGTIESLSWAGFSPASGWGLGAVAAGESDSLSPVSAKVYGVGLGKALWNTHFTLGASFIRWDIGMGFPSASGNVLTAGAMFGRPGDRLKVGVRANNITEDDFIIMDGVMTFDAGIAWQINSRLLLAADGIDITEKLDPLVYNVGTEYCVNPSWTARLGVGDVSNDARWSGGLGFRKDSWRLDVGYLNAVDETVWNITGGITF
jgi:hypothetical protein